MTNGHLYKGDCLIARDRIKKAVEEREENENNLHPNQTPIL